MARIAIAFDEHFESSNAVTVGQDGELAEHLHIWVWDLYYASTLHALADTPYAAQLRSTLETWAGAVAAHILAPADTLRREGLLSIDAKLRFGAVDAAEEAYAIEVQDSSETGWPDIRVDSSRARQGNRQAYSVIALAHHFLAQNLMFARELPLHVLAMRKFYNEEQGPQAPTSRMEAPLYALNKAMKFYQDMQQGGAAPRLDS